MTRNEMKQALLHGSKCDLKFNGGTILEFKEKHESRFVILDREGTWKGAILQILQDHLDMNYFLIEDKPQRPLTSIKDINPKDKDLLDECRKQHSEFKYLLHEWENSMKTLESVKRALKDKDAYLALQILRSRDDYEYEEVREHQAMNGRVV